MVDGSDGRVEVERADLAHIRWIDDLRCVHKQGQSFVTEDSSGVEGATYLYSSKLVYLLRHGPYLRVLKARQTEPSLLDFALVVAKG